MRALSLRQPWASLVTIGVKTIETRSWATKYRGPLAIHAAKRRPPIHWHRPDADLPPAIDLYAMDPCWEWTEGDDYCGSYRWTGPLGAIVATAQLVDCVPIVDAQWAEDQDWADLPYPRLESGLDGDPEAFPDGILDLYHPSWAIGAVDEGVTLPGAEASYGDYEPGRWAWLLDDVRPVGCTCPVCNGGGFVEVDPPEGETGDWIDDCHTCDGIGAVMDDSIPAKGHAGLWEWTS